MSERLKCEGLNILHVETSILFVGSPSEVKEYVENLAYNPFPSAQISDLEEYGDRCWNSGYDSGWDAGYDK